MTLFLIPRMSQTSKRKASNDENEMIEVNENDSTSKGPENSKPKKKKIGVQTKVRNNHLLRYVILRRLH